MKTKQTLQEQANEIIEQAQERGVSSNFFFVTTFKRYQVQMAALQSLEAAIKEAYRLTDGVKFEGAYRRSDIGQRALQALK